MTREHTVFPMTDRGDLLLIEEVAQIARVSVETVRFGSKRRKFRRFDRGVVE
jgi:hypothetical protein